MASVNTSKTNGNLKRRHSQVDGPGAEEQPINRQIQGYPFDSFDADCILRSSNDVDFCVHTLILSLASPFFRTMFSLLKGAAAKLSIDEVNDGLPIVPVSENDRTLHILLSLCYPVPPPTVKRFRDLTRAYEAAEKYEMNRMLPHIADALVDKASQDVVAAYAFGYRHRLTDLVITAAKITLQNPLSDLGRSPELDLITGTQLQHLHVFHRSCREKAVGLADDWAWVKTISAIPLASDTKNCDCQIIITLHDVEPIRGTTSTFEEHGKEDKQEFYAPEWWYDYMDKATEALKHRPVASTITDPLFCASTFGAASKCDEPDCADGVKLMHGFIELFAKKIDQAVDSVRSIHTLPLYIYSIKDVIRRLRVEPFNWNRWGKCLVQ